MIYITKLKNIFVFFFSSFISIILKISSVKIKDNTLLIIRLDSIGDYLLFRNYIEILKKSKQYKNFSITLCGNIAFKEIAEKLDSKFVDKFIWINRKKFYSNLFYKFSILKNIRQKGFEVIINPTYTREILYGDLIVKTSGAKLKIGSSGAIDKHLKWKIGLFGKSIYDIVIPASNENLFEFVRNKEFFESLLKEKITLSAPRIQLKEQKIKNILNDYAVLFIGGQDVERKWSPSNYSVIANYIIDNFSLPVIICGGINETNEAELICNSTKSNKIINKTGQTNLIELIDIIKHCKFLVSNETSAVHMAACVKTPFICINKGGHLGRFSPYPNEIYDGGLYVFPEKLENNFDEYIKNDKFRFESKLNINLVKPDAVINAINKILMNK